LPVDGKDMFKSGHLIATYAGPGQSGEEIEIESKQGWENIAGRYLIIQMDKTAKPDYLNLQEVTAFGKLESTTTATATPTTTTTKITSEVSVKLEPSEASMSSSYDDRYYSAQKCINGKYPGRIWGQKEDICVTMKDPAPWVAIDYGDKTRVSVEKVVLVNRGHNSFGHRTAAVEVRLSDSLPVDGKDMFKSGHLIATYDGPGQSGEEIEIVSKQGWENIAGRYLIIQMDKTAKPDYLNLQEVTAFGKHATTTPASDGKCMGKFGGQCEFPLMTSYGMQEDCHFLKEKYSWITMPLCFTWKGPLDECDPSDVDCPF